MDTSYWYWDGDTAAADMARDLDIAPLGEPGVLRFKGRELDHVWFVVSAVQRHPAWAGLAALSVALVGLAVRLRDRRRVRVSATFGSEDHIHGATWHSQWTRCDTVLAGYMAKARAADAHALGFEAIDAEALERSKEEHPELAMWQTPRLDRTLKLVQALAAVSAVLAGAVSHRHGKPHLGLLAVVAGALSGGTWWYRRHRMLLDYVGRVLWR